VNHDTQIVIGPDGIVLGATGELAAGLIDVRLEACERLPREVRDAQPELLLLLRQSPGRVVTLNVTLDGGGGRHVQLVAIEALVIRRTPTDLRGLLASKLAVLTSQAVSSDVSLNILVSEKMPAAAQIDAEKVAWSVTTLVGNALRYVQQGSRRMTGRSITVGAAFDPSAGEVSIEVRDDGPGIPPDTVARLFRRDGLNVQGAGLALLLMSDICAAHGGRLDVKSSTAPSDHGTTVRMTFAVG
jgi:signal transduction histidine kinase